MADLADLAQEGMEQMEELSKRPSIFEGASLAECQECGEEIPKQRQALGGVKFCVECQRIRESKR